MKQLLVNTQPAGISRRHSTRTIMLAALLAVTGSIIAFEAVKATPATGCGTAVGCQKSYTFQMVCRPKIYAQDFKCETGGDAFGGVGYSKASDTDKCGGYKDCEDKPALCAAFIPGGPCAQPE